MTNIRKSLQKLGALTLLSAAMAVPNLSQASAIVGPGGQIFATGGNVQVEVLPSSSGYTNEIDFFYGVSLSSLTFIGFDNFITTVNLGAFSTGQELVFGIRGPEGTFLMGGGSRNADGRIHANVANDFIASGFSEAWYVGFEDLYGGGDRDYNDAIIRVSQTTPVPEPGTLGLLGLGLAGLGMFRRRKA